MTFNKKISLFIDRCTVARERGYWLARVVKWVLEEIFIPKRTIR